MRRLLLALIAVVGCRPLSAVNAYDEERAKNNFSHELVICAAYFNIGAEGAKRTGDKKASEMLQQVSDALLEDARKYNKDETVLARFQLALEEQANLIHRDYANLSIVQVKHKDLCKQVSENPHARLEYWRGKSELAQQALRADLGSRWRGSLGRSREVLGGLNERFLDSIGTESRRVCEHTVSMLLGRRFYGHTVHAHPVG